MNSTVLVRIGRAAVLLLGGAYLLASCRLGESMDGFSSGEGATAGAGGMGGTGGSGAIEGAAGSDASGTGGAAGSSTGGTAGSDASSTGGAAGSSTGGTAGTAGSSTGGAAGADGGSTGGTAGLDAGSTGGTAGADASSTGGTAGSDSGTGGCSAACGPLEECSPGGLCAAKLVAMPSGYRVDATEVTQAQYAAWLSQNPSVTGQPAYCGWKTGFIPIENWLPVEKGSYPVVGVDWCDALAYCTAVGKRLCGKIGGGANAFNDYADAARSEWMRACSSGAHNEYPYGNIYSGATCNGFDAPAQDTVEVGTMTGCESSESGYQGVFDLSGNVYEWENSCDGIDGVSDWCHIRGGGYIDYGVVDLGCSGNGNDFRDARLIDVGIRCCAP